MTNKLWKDDIAYAITPFKLISWPIGVWPLQVYDVYSLLRCVLGICCASVLTILPSMELYMGCTDVNQTIESLMMISCGFLGALKTIWFRIYPHSLINNYGSALNDYQTIDDVEARDIMRKHASIGRIIFGSFLGVSYVNGLVYSTYPILDYIFNNDNRINTTNEYSIPSRCALEYFNFSNMHKISCVAETLIMMLAISANLGNDALFLNIILHVCGQVNILKIHFVNFDATSSRIYDRFNILIQRHRYLITLARGLADLISFILLIKLCLISILICVSGFMLIFALKVNDTVFLTKSSLTVMVFLIQLSMYSFIGNYLKSEMEEIGLSIYQSAWYNFPNKLTKNVIFIIMQTKSPVTLKAGNFLPINMSTFVNILKTSFSYFSVLRLMFEV